MMSRSYNQNLRGAPGHDGARPKNKGGFGFAGHFGGQYNSNQNYRGRRGGRYGNNYDRVYTMYPDPDPINDWGIVPLPARKAEPEPDPSIFGRMHINQMNEDCLIMLFRKFAVQEQIRFRKVCKWWKEVVERMFFNRKSIKIFGNNDDIFLYCNEIPKYNLHRDEDFILRASGHRDDDLVCKTNAALIALPLFFPNLRKLLICHYQSAWQHELPLVLNWLPNLESLTIFGVQSNGRLPPGFWSSINHLYNLEELHLLDSTKMQIPFDLYVLNRLKKFTLTDYDFHTGACIQELSSNLQLLRLDNIQITTHHFRLCLDANPGMPRNLRHLTIGQLDSPDYVVCYKDLFGIIGHYFTNLVSLDVLVYTNIRFFDVITELAKLTALTDLAINIGWTGPLHFENANMSPQLPSVKRLSINDKFLNKDSFRQIFPRVFPSIEFLLIDSVKSDVLKELQDSNVFTLFPNLIEFKPIFQPIHDIRHLDEIDYSYAGRHKIKFAEYMCEYIPVTDHPEDLHDEILDFLYEEGGGDDEDLIYAVFNA